MSMQRAVDDVSGYKGAVLPMTSPKETEASEPIPRARVGKRGGAVSALVWRGVLAAVVAGLLSAGSASPAAAEDTCANAVARAQTGSAALPDCRAYEMVSPPYKQGFPVTPTAFSDDGIVSYRSPGNFAGNTNGILLGIKYYATRSAAGWTTTAPSPREAIYDTRTTGFQAESADLRQSLWLMNRRDVPGDAFGFWLRGPDGGFTRIGNAEIDAVTLGSAPGIQGVSDDLSHVVFNYGSAGSSTFTALREYVGTGNGGPPRMVTVDNNGQPSPLETCPADMSDDARVIVYSLVTEDGCAGDVRRQLWARVAGSATVAVSRSECTRTSGDLGGLCNGVSAAEFGGMADDGSRVFFTTSQQLVNGDTNAGNDLYACDIPAGAPAPVGLANPCASLRQVSGTAANAQVENVVAVSADGARVYFVAQGVLASNVGVGDVDPAPGGHNLYVWEHDGAHPAGQTRFVARLGSGGDISQAQMTPDGRYLLVVADSGLVTEGPGADTDNGRDVYRYDADTRVMVRVSTSVAGGGGNALDSPAGIADLSSMTSDGSTVIFGTTEALALDDTNGGGDVYSWHNGQVSLISVGGGSPVGITPSGRDIFFVTGAPVLAAADGDVITDIYNARVGGGFEHSLTPEPCSGDQCQGQHSQLPPLAGPSAPVFGSPGPSVAASAFSLRAVSAAQRKRLAATGKVSLTVTANAAGTVGAQAAATLGGRSVAVGSAKRTLTAPGRVTVALTLSKKARAQLARRGRLTVKIAVSHSKVALDRSVTLRLVHAKAKKPAKRASGGQS